LHPSLMDGALQAAVGLVRASESNCPLLPFAMESLRIVSPCTAEMFAWVRHAMGSQAGESVKLDIDLCTERGDICVEMRGFSLRVLNGDTGHVTGPLLATPVWQPSELGAGGIVEFAEHHVISVGAVYDRPQFRIVGGHRPPLQLYADPQQTIAQRYSEYAL